MAKSMRSHQSSNSSIPEQELWLMSILVNLNSRIPQPISHVDQGSTTSTKSYTFPPNLRIFCRTQIREVYSGPLLRLILVEWLSATMWKTGPFPWLSFANSNTSAPDYQRDVIFKKELNSLLGTILKGEKNNFANLLRLGLGGANPPIPRQVVRHYRSVYKAMDSCFEQTPVANIRHSRITVQRQANRHDWLHQEMINLNRLRHIANPGQTAFPSFWDDIDADLETRRTKNTPMFNQMFGHLVIEKDHRLWDGKKSLTTGPDLDVQLPTDAEVQARIAQEAGNLCVVCSSELSMLAIFSL
ncbi:hypothetical protein KEM48_010276 [Puccinia striiformis f. sp. tritici PST-130]|nr:hypothetical protein KEM48_010276 [Puccinia striiformis f. sp. tritici PST-130]